MRLIRFLYHTKLYWGIIEDDTKVTVLAHEPFVKIQPVRKKIPLTGIRIVAPANPSKIILVGLNYKNHARELGLKIPKQPIIFLKPPTSIIGYGAIIKYPGSVRRLDYEAELALVIKKEAKNVTTQDAHKYILGFTCLNDITARDQQRKDVQWTRAKSYDTFCPLGPWIETKLAPGNLSVKSFVNGSLRQNSSTSNLIFSVARLVSFISSIMTLQAGDVISTGTPPGIGALKRGDMVEVAIQGIGVLKNYVR
ncbi:MAG: fumarylacetoacetate hydrolase family protein [Candidatus Omnitrophica bacterium]|nr:fumarylacetoacetate hydrolase family protein [Candidatus Omnitrophota bacterium]